MMDVHCAKRNPYLQAPLELALALVLALAWALAWASWALAREWGVVSAEEGHLQE